MLADLRFAFRLLTKAPAFCVVVILTLALSIGSCITIFSLINSVLLAGYGAEPDRSVALVQMRAPSVTPIFITGDDWSVWEQKLQSFELLMAHRPAASTLTGVGEPVRLEAKVVTSRYFDFYGNRFLLGRGFLPEEHIDETSGGVVILSGALWQRVFGGTSDIVGQVVRVDGAPHTVVGVTDDRVFAPGDGAEAFLPLTLTKLIEMRRPPNFHVRGILKRGVSVTQAQAELDVVHAWLAREFPERNQGTTSSVTLLREYLTRTSRPILLTLFGAVVAVLLIGCANIASLLLVRAAIRQRELSLRLALGASRARIVRQLFTESLLLATLGGIFGVLLAAWAGEALRNHPLVNSIEPRGMIMDARMVAFTIGATLLTALLFGLVPAWLSSKADLMETIKQGGRGNTESGSSGRMRRWLVIGEVICTTTLLAIAGLFIRSFVQITRLDLGFLPEQAVAMSVSLPRSIYTTPEQRLQFTEAVISRLSALREVEAAGLTEWIGFAATAINTFGFSVDQLGPTDRQVWPRAYISTVSHGYFKAAQVRLTRGRFFREGDTMLSPRVAVINESFARHHFPGADPVGHRIFLREVWHEIVGVVSDFAQGNAEQPVAPHFFRAFAQSPGPTFSFIVRMRGDVDGMGRLLRSQVYDVDPNQPVGSIVPLREFVDGRVSARRFEIQLLSTFSLLALVIAMVGIYGIISYTVSQRTAEIGIRIALGAQARDVVRLVFTEGARVVGVGLLLGLVGALVAGRLIEARMFQTSSADPLTLGGIVLLLAGVAALACWVPARRATEVDPIIALRAE